MSTLSVAAEQLPHPTPFTKLFKKFIVVVYAEKDVGFGKQGKNFGNVFLGQTSRYDKLFKLSRALVSGALQNRVDSLLPC